MIKQYTLTLEYDNPQKASVHWGYQFYSMLMEYLPTDVVEQFHEQNLTPISQHIKPLDSGKLKWIISLLGNDIQKIVNTIENLETLTMKTKGITFIVVDKICNIEVSDKEFVELAKLENYERNIYKLRFVTPSSFKVDGSYAIFPSPEHIIYSLINRWNSFSETIEIKDEYALKEIIGKTKIISYKLKTATYSMKQQKIQGFIGEVVLQGRLPVPLLEILNLLIEFSTYSGIGIKTALGMGAIEIGE